MKTGGRLVKHAEYYWILLAKWHLNRKLFWMMLGRIRELPLPSRQHCLAEGRLDNSVPELPELPQPTDHRRSHGHIRAGASSADSTFRNPAATALLGVGLLICRPRRIIWAA
jgi:hypothetical protein